LRGGPPRTRDRCAAPRRDDSRPIQVSDLPQALSGRASPMGPQPVHDLEQRGGKPMLSHPNEGVVAVQVGAGPAKPEGVVVPVGRHAARRVLAGLAHPRGLARLDSAPLPARDFARKLARGAEDENRTRRDDHEEGSAARRSDRLQGRRLEQGEAPLFRDVVDVGAVRDHCHVALDQEREPALPAQFEERFLTAVPASRSRNRRIRTSSA
jgi:hypothetical protein